MEVRRKILIDTDIGDDIDDAFALYYAMNLGFDLVGVTTVFRNTQERARVVKRMLCAYGNGYERVPVYAGCHRYRDDAEEEYPRLHEYSEELEREEYRPSNTDPHDAVDFILDCCRRYGKDLTIVAIGPFGNIAKAIEKDPQALNGIARVVVMGGAFFKQYTDWNVMCDVEAADVMLRSLKNLECLGADVTHRLALTEEELAPILHSPNSSDAVRCVREAYAKWKEAKPTAPFVVHDALVIHYLLDPDVCGMRDVCVHLFTDGYARGLTLNVDAYRHTFLNDAYQDFDFDRRTKVAETVDRERFMKKFISSFM